jgi:hypothetical protein
LGIKKLCNKYNNEKYPLLKLREGLSQIVNPGEENNYFTAGF